jgi:uncharacterized protein YmfQ (DUF2313 family)
MSVNRHREALALLFPVELGGDHGADLDIDGASLDAAQASAEVLLAEMFPDQTSDLLTDWERVVGNVPGPNDPLQDRRDRVVMKLRQLGGLSVGYFLGLAQTLGYTVSIVEPVPLMAGWGAAGDTLYAPEIDGQWGVEIMGKAIYHFRAGQSSSGESLTWWQPDTVLEDLFRELKPAHTFVYFSYL